MTKHDAGSPPSDAADLVRRFESGDIALAHFNHQAHLTVAVCFLQRMTPDEALTYLRAKLHQLLAHHQAADAYNETATVFWLRFVRHHLEVSKPACLIEEAVTSMLVKCGDSRFIFRYYTKEFLASPHARASWHEPDVRPLDF